MKKILLIAATVGIAATSNAQRMSIYEEFSGENCAPCAGANPGLWTLLTSGTNPNNIILVKYQSPIPSAGPIYNAYKTVTDARMTYYSVPFAPYGRLNGTGLGTGTAASGSPGHVSNLIQADIDAATAAGSPFKITVTAAYNASGDSVYTTVKVDCITAYSGSTMKLRIGMIEHLVYLVAPGTNGEKDFHNVVREMYPNAGGTTIANTWAVGATQTYIIGGLVKSFVKKSNGPKMVAWIQDDATKAIPQSAVSAPLPTTFPTNLTANPVTFPSSINCVGGTIAAPSVSMKNSGTTTTITSATIYYRVGTGAWANKAWTGSLAPGASTSVTLNPITLPAAAGDYIITDSIVIPMVDQDIADNVNASLVTVVSTAPNPLPLFADFETGAGFPVGYTAYDSDGSGSIWVNGSGGAGSTYCHSGTFMPWFKLSTYAAGSSSMLIMPTPASAATRTLEFWEAYAQTNASSSDKLEVVYSSNCGTTWTPLYSTVGSAHNTTAPTSAYWLPSRLNATDWVKRSVNISTVPANSILAFRATAGGGNNLFLDDVNLRSGGLSIKNEISILSTFTISPNPASDKATLSFHLGEATTINVAVVDALGRTIVSQNEGNMTVGAHEVSINTTALATGMYLVKVSTENGSITEKLSVVK